MALTGADKTVKVTLVAVASPYVKGTSEAAAATNKLGRDIDNVGTKSQAAEGKMSKLTGSLKGFGAAVGVAAGAGLVAFFTDAVKAAGDLEQSVGGVDAVFKGAAKSIHEFGKDSADAVGLSTNEFNQLVTVTGAMLKNKGLSDFADKSLDLVKIGADLAAQFGGPTADAVGALNAAMRGESDPIERYGISLNETAVNAELAAKGLDGLTGAALDQAKAQARIDIIMRQSADAMGAFAREADTLQGQQQRLNAEWENAQAELGTALLPVLTDVMSALRGGVDVIVAVAGAWEKVPGPVKAAVTALAAFRLLRGPLGSAIGAIRTNLAGLMVDLKSTGSAMGGFRAAGRGMLGVLGGPWGLAVGGAAAALGLFVQAQQDAEGRVQALTDTLDKQTGAFTENSRTVIRDALMGALSGADQELLQSLGVSFTELADVMLQGGEALHQYRLRLIALYDANPQAASAIGGLVDEINRQAPAAQDAAAEGRALARENKNVGDEAKAADPKVSNYADATDDLKNKSEDAEKKQRDLAKAILEVVDAATDADSAEIGYERTLDEVQERIAKRVQLEKDLKAASDPKERARLKEELKDYALTLDVSTKAGQDNKQGLIDLATEARAAAEAMLANNEGVKATAETMKQRRQDFVDLAMQMNGGNKKAAEELADEYGLTEQKVKDMSAAMEDVPAEVVTKLKADADQAMEELRILKAALAQNLDKTVTIRTRLLGSAGVGGIGTAAYGRGALAGNYATGGPVVGPGTGTSDSIPAYLSNGEYVIKASAVEKYGRHFFDGLNAMRFADGGYVSRMSSSPAIDYDRLAALVGGGNGPVTFNAYGQDADAAAQRAMRDWEWRNRA